MLIKLAALGTLGYVGYKVLQSARQDQTTRTAQPSDLRLAGGPLSDAATVQHSVNGQSPQPLTR
jgi:hypothetical protein